MSAKKRFQTKLEKEYLERHPKSRTLYERALKTFARGVTHDARFFKPIPIYCVNAEGSKKWDVDGNEYIDYWMGHGALILGHAHPVVTEAAVNQARRGTHLGASHELEIEWAEKVKRLLRCAREGLVEFTSSGTEATLLALRLARAYTGRERIIKFLSHFHGWLDYTIIDYNPEYSPTLKGAFPSGIPDGTLRSVSALPPNDIEAVEKTIENGDVACVILEPGGASMGYLPTYKPFLEQLRKVTRENGVILIFDEVVTGFRDAPGGAQEHYGVTPDLSILGKILGGGYPGGAVAGRREIVEMLDFKDEEEWAYRRVRHPGTFNANPLSAAAGNACLGLILKGEVHPEINYAGEKLRSAFNDAFEDSGVNGLAWGTTDSIVYVGFGFSEEDLEVSNIQDYVNFQEKKARNSEAIAHLDMAMINRGVHPMGSRFILSIMHTEEDLQKTAECFEESLKELKSEGLLKDFV
ncbi:aspartate aminotransferase family protein [Candidatus Bathyarchaeota archaeon]|nr:MAG: aspartate aminotransferase family protein [Candidatus Bathyarchaeota archaeon]